MKNLTVYYIITAVFLIFLLLFLWKLKRKISKSAPNEILHQDLSEGLITSKFLYSKKYNLGGKPDEIVIIDGKTIPVEWKSSRFRGHPYKGHILQLAAYCLLIEEEYRKKPPYGILKYGEKEIPPILFTNELRASLLTKIKKMREINPEEDDLPPICDDVRKCKNCGYNYFCHTDQPHLL